MAGLFRVALFGALLTTLVNLLEPLSSPLRGDEFLVTFRDGSVVRMTIDTPALTYAPVDLSGQAAPESLPLSAIERLDLVQDNVTRRVDVIRSWISQLGSEDYSQREAASSELRQQGAEFLDLIEAQAAAEDPEIRWRVSEIVDAIRTGRRVRRAIEFDTVTLAPDAPAHWLSRASAERRLEGDFGELAIQASGWDNTWNLDRQQLASLRRVGVAESQEVASGGARIGHDQVSNSFPENATRLEFDALPDGSFPADGTPIGDAFAAQGVRLTTSLEGGVIAAFEFKVSGAPSAGISAAGRRLDTTDENYRGVTTFTFHVPGRPEIPATVTKFGCYLALIKPNGTLLRFFDSQGRLISQQSTVRPSWDFVGFRSETPIARVEIHPTTLDPNYAFDDVLFDRPEPRADLGAPGVVMIGTRDGQRLRGADFRLEDGQLLLLQTSVGPESIAIPLEQLELLVPPRLEEAAERAPGMWIRTHRGDRLRASLSAAGARTELEPLVLFAPSDVQAIWREGQRDLELLLGTVSEQPVWLNAETPTELHPLPNPTWTDSGIDSSGAESTWQSISSFNDLPVVLFGPPTIPDDSAPILRTRDGQCWIIDGVRTRWLGWTAESVQIVDGDIQVTIPLSQVAAIRFPSFAETP